MLTLDEKLRSTHRYATLSDFRLGLDYEEVQPTNGGRLHGFVKRTVRETGFSTACREFVMLVNNRLALVATDDVPSDEFIKASNEIMKDEEVRELLASYPDKEKAETIPPKETKRKTKKA
jgi:hypothetical protein